MRALARAAVLPCLLVALPARAAPDADLGKARNAYQYGDYKLVTDTLQPLLYPTVQFATADQVVEARRLLALGFLWQKDDSRAEMEFVALLTLRPDYSLDPLVDPPTFIAFFDKIKTRIHVQLEEIRRKQEEAAHAKEAEAEAARERIAELEKKLAEEQRTAYVVESQEKSRLVASLPLGMGQFQNGHVRKGVAFFVAETLLGAASLTLALAVKIKWPDAVYPPDERDEADAYASAQVITGVAFFVAAAWGIVDAHVYFVPRKQAPPRRVPRDTLRVGLAPSPGGLVIGGAF